MNADKTLFNNHLPPLAERVRPKTIKEFYGQEHLTKENKIINQILKSGKIFSLILWGPPGTGKTTVLGKIISDYVKNDETVLLCSNTNRAVDVSILKALEVSSFEDTPIKEKSLRWGNIYLEHEEDLQYVTLSNHIERKRKEKEDQIKNTPYLILYGKDTWKEKRGIKKEVLVLVIHYLTEILILLIRCQLGTIKMDQKF